MVRVDFVLKDSSLVAQPRGHRISVEFETDEAGWLGACIDELFSRLQPANIPRREVDLAFVVVPGSGVKLSVSHSHEQFSGSGLAVGQDTVRI